jgi:putative FmdB family regulatory protein
MPIYAYKCESCGFAKDVLQKMSDAPLSDCPTCGVSAFKKQLTAAGFQLKGSGWYATDFKGGAAAKSSTAGDSETSSTAVVDGTKSPESSTAKPDAVTPSASGSCGGACACH